MTRDAGRIAKWAFGVALAIANLALVLLSSDRRIALAIVTVTVAAGWMWNRSVRSSARRRTNAAAAHLSHELRTPLTSVLGIMDVLGDDSMPLEDTERAELLGLAHSEALHMNHVVSNLIASNRIARDLLEPDPTVVSLDGLVSEALHRLPSVERRTFVAGGRIPLVYADPALTLQVLLNLLQNVERYAPDGAVEIEFDTERDHVVVSVSDDGPGLAGATAFRMGSSNMGLGLGLPLSRQLARLMGGDLRSAAPRRDGATLELSLPIAVDAQAEATGDATTDRSPVVALSPRARLLVDMAGALAERSLDRVVAGIRRQCVELLGAGSMMLLVPSNDGGFERAGSFLGAADPADLEREPLDTALAGAGPLVVEHFSESAWPMWADALEAEAALFVPVVDDEATKGVLIVGWSRAAALPGPQGQAVVVAMAELVSFAMDRSALSRSADFERGVRSSVMESLPIAISVFAGDPPRVIDWNEQERRLLGLAEDIQRPSDLDATQHLFDVRFADGTPLTVDTAPVTQAIRSGESTGPFFLLVKRMDGSEVVTRTHCAPFFGSHGEVAGAVVTSEELDADAARIVKMEASRRSA